MGNYLLRRLLIALPSLLGISLVLFTVLALAPGDPFEELATNPNVPAEVRLALRAQLGLDDPVWQRYVHWLGSMLQGHWGFSFVSRIDVDTLIWQRLPVTAAIVGASLVLALVVALPVGVLAAVKPYSWFDRIASTLAFIGFSLPTFFIGLLFILLFSIKLDWLPFVFRADLQETGWAWWWEHFKQSIMPVSVLGLALAASWMRYVRSSVLDVIRRTRAARTVLDDIDPAEGGQSDYSGPLVSDFDFAAFSQSALVRMADEVCACKSEKCVSSALDAFAKQKDAQKKDSELTSAERADDAARIALSGAAA